MPRPFGHTLNFTLTRSRPWLSLGPGWAALAGALSTGALEATPVALLRLLSLWLLVDPILGTLWHLLVRQGLGRHVTQASLPPASPRGFALPYAQTESMAGRGLLLLRRYRAWWQESFWPESGNKVTALSLNLALASLIGLFLGPAIFWLTLLAVGLTLWAGQRPLNLTAPGGGRVEALLQFLLPWLMGSLLGAALTPPGLALAICYSATYLGGLRILGQHRQADRLFFLGQLAAMLLLLAMRVLPGAAVLSVLLVSQWLFKSKFSRPADFLQKVQFYLVLVLLVAGLSAGSLC